MKALRGFTLIELLIVMAVIAALIAIVVPSFRGMQQEAKRTRAASELATLKLVVETYYKNNGQYPAVANYQTTLMADSTILDHNLYDPFAAANTTYVYALGVGAAPATAKYYILYSIGPSGAGSATVDNGTGVVTPAGDVIWNGNGH